MRRAVMAAFAGLVVATPAAAQAPRYATMACLVTRTSAPDDVRAVYGALICDALRARGFDVGAPTETRPPVADGARVSIFAPNPETGMPLHVRIEVERPWGNVVSTAHVRAREGEEPEDLARRAAQVTFAGRSPPAYAPPVVDEPPRPKRDDSRIAFGLAVTSRSSPFGTVSPATSMAWELGGQRLYARLGGRLEGVPESVPALVLDLGARAHGDGKLGWLVGSGIAIGVQRVRVDGAPSRTYSGAPIAIPVELGSFARFDGGRIAFLLRADVPLSRMTNEDVVEYTPGPPRAPGGPPTQGTTKKRTDEVYFVPVSFGVEVAF